MTHGREEEAERIVDDIERVRNYGVELTDVPDSKAIEIHSMAWSHTRTSPDAPRQYPGSRPSLGFSMMVTQAFLYNAIFTYALVLQHFYKIPSDRIGFLFPFAAGNLAGPLLLGFLFDSIGRRKMIVDRWGIGHPSAISAVVFHAGLLNAITQTIFWRATSSASAGASSAYLTVSEVFPLELRAQAISAFSQLQEGVELPDRLPRSSALEPIGCRWTIGYFIGAGTHDRRAASSPVLWGYFERQPLEAIAMRSAASSRKSNARAPAERFPYPLIALSPAARWRSAHEQDRARRKMRSPV